MIGHAVFLPDAGGTAPEPPRKRIEEPYRPQSVPAKGTVRVAREPELEIFYVGFIDRELLSVSDGRTESGVTGINEGLGVRSRDLQALPAVAR